MISINIALCHEKNLNNWMVLSYNKSQLNSIFNIFNYLSYLFSPSLECIANKRVRDSQISAKAYEISQPLSKC